MKKNRKEIVFKKNGGKKLNKPHCRFCGGVGEIGEKARNIFTPSGTKYRVPLSHTSCAESVRHPLL